MKPHVIQALGCCPKCRGSLVLVDEHTNTWCLYCSHPYTSIFWRYRWMQPALVGAFVGVTLAIVENFR